MKFTKTFLAVAIAGIAVAPMMASATTTLSGVVEVGIFGDDTGEDSEFNNVDEGDARIDVSDVLMGVSVEQALNIGLTGYGSLRYDLDTISGGGNAEADNVFVGIKGGFGDFRFGETPNPSEYGQVNDINTDVGETINAGISYVGSFGGATVGVAYSPQRSQDIIGVGAKFGWRGFSIGVGAQDLRVVTDEVEAVAADLAAGVDPVVGIARSEKQKTNFSASVGFAYAGANIGLGYVQLGDFLGDEAAGFEDETAFVAQVGYSIAGVSLQLDYDVQEESEDDKLRLNASYALGGGMTVSSRVNVFNDGADDEADDVTDWRVQLSKTF